MVNIELIGFFPWGQFAVGRIYEIYLCPAGPLVHDLCADIDIYMVLYYSFSWLEEVPDRLMTKTSSVLSLWNQ